MLTRSRYKCAGWHVIRISNSSWLMKSNSGFKKEGGMELQGTFTEIVDEYNRLRSMVTMLEAEKHAKIHA